MWWIDGCVFLLWMFYVLKCLSGLVFIRISGGWIIGFVFISVLDNVFLIGLIDGQLVCSMLNVQFVVFVGYMLVGRCVVYVLIMMLLLLCLCIRYGSVFVLVNVMCEWLLVLVVVWVNMVLLNVLGGRNMIWLFFSSGVVCVVSVLCDVVGSGIMMSCVLCSVVVRLLVRWIVFGVLLSGIECLL